MAVILIKHDKAKHVLFFLSIDLFFYLLFPPLEMAIKKM